MIKTKAGELGKRAEWGFKRKKQTTHAVKSICRDRVGNGD